MTFFSKKSVLRAIAATAAGVAFTFTLTGEISAQSSSTHHHPGAQARGVFSHALPPMNGKNLTVKISEVTFAPGASSAPHRHPCPVVVYVLSGAMRMQVKGQPEGIYKAGETFFETPNDIHLLSANASKTKPAKFLAYFVCEGNPSKMVIPAPGVKAPRTGEAGSR
jgi:quercetin dioxygenase-like cupin family protein